MLAALVGRPWKFWHSIAAVAVLLIACVARPVSAADQPWFPSEWGADDQRGAANRITPERTLAALLLPKSGRIYPLSQPFRADMPIWGGRSFQLTIPLADKPPSKNALTAHLDFVAGELGQVGTQLDGLGHVGIGDLYYNGNDRRQFAQRSGLKRLGIENAGAFVSRGVLIDVAAYKGMTRLPAGYEVTAADLQGALALEGLTVREGDTLLMRTGWSQLWNKDPAAYLGNAPGWGPDACEWIVQMKPSTTGCDTYGCDVVPNPSDAEVLWPCHQIMGTKAGIYNVENLDLEGLAADRAHEFLFIMTPLPLVGASGSPVAPIAIR